MLKNILNNFNKKDKSLETSAKKKQPIGATEEHADKNCYINYDEMKKKKKMMMMNENATIPLEADNQKTPNNGRLISRKGRKRLSAMMSKLQSSIQLSQKASAASLGCDVGKPDGHQLRHQAANDNFNNDSDDDDDYKSAEEMCSMDDTRHSARWPTTTTTTTKALETDTTTTSGKHNNDSSLDGKEILLPEEDCDIPTFLHTKNCAKHLIDETRRQLRDRYACNPDSFYDNDYKRMLHDDWTVSRFLLRRRLEPKRAAKLMEECGRFRKQYKMSEVKLWEFPIEFHKAGGLFKYSLDRVGNVTLYMRVKMYRRVPEISDVFKAFILCVLEECDVENNGRGTAIIFDLSNCGLQNVDLSFLSWLLSSFRNYCPKGVSYIIVYNLPWILNATCKLAMTWMSDNNRRSLRFAHGKEIENYIARESLPDYCGGTCKINYRSIPEGSRPAIDVCEQLDISQKQALKIKELFKEYLGNDDDNNVTGSRPTTSSSDQFVDSKSPYFDDAKLLTNPTENGAQSVIANEHPPTRANLHNQQQQPARILPPVVGLVSQASKFIAH